MKSFKGTFWRAWYLSSGVWGIQGNVFIHIWEILRWEIVTINVRWHSFESEGGGRREEMARERERERQREAETERQRLSQVCFGSEPKVVVWGRVAGTFLEVRWTSGRVLAWGLESAWGPGEKEVVTNQRSGATWGPREHYGGLPRETTYIKVTAEELKDPERKYQFWMPS